MKLNSGVAYSLYPALLVIAIIGCFFSLAHFLVRQLSAPQVVSSYPLPDEVGIPGAARQSLHFNKRMAPESLSSKTLVLYNEQNQVVPAQVSYDASSFTAMLDPSRALEPGRAYRLTALGGKDGVKDSWGHPLAGDLVRTFSTGVKTATAPTQGPGGPILVITSSENNFSQYYAEILRNEGFNEFETEDVSKITTEDLSRFEVAVLGEIPLSGAQIAMLTRWISQGGDLIAMRPEARLAEALRIQVEGGEGGNPVEPTFHDGYLAIRNNTPEGAGLVHQPIQFHGPATTYRVGNGTVVAALYTNFNTSTASPAVSISPLGLGHVALFAYDLARSVIYTRQGNPSWSGMERDGIPPIRSNDLFYGASASDPQPDWVDTRDLAIPQADVQQRLLANIITLASMHKTPLPHFWYLPWGLRAVVAMTGDDHGRGGTVARFNHYLARSPEGCSVRNWECIRATSNVFIGSVPVSEAQRLVGRGFEIGLHVYTGCADWPTKVLRGANGTSIVQVDRESADHLYRKQLAAFASVYPGVPAPITNRIDCITWGDYDSQPQIEWSHGIRLDTNYYFWPAKWVRKRIGFFTGSGLPMRFARRDGSIVDVYQAATQMTDESAQDYPETINTLLDNALGPAESFGVFTANMHNDNPDSPGADAIISSALKRHVPVVTAAQVLNWLDGRNSSSFQDLTWSGGQLTFRIRIGENASGLEVLLPVISDAGNLASVTVDGASLPFHRRSIGGLTYAAFPARLGRVQATYRVSRG